MNSISEWQKKFLETPIIWYTYYKYGGSIEISNFYDSEEGAKLEQDWCRKNNNEVPKIGINHIHSLELSKERWLD